MSSVEPGNGNRQAGGKNPEMERPSFFHTVFSWWLVRTGEATGIARLVKAGRLGWARFSAGGEKGGRPIERMAARGNLVPAECGIAEGSGEKTKR